MSHLRGARPRPPEPSGPIVGHRLPMLDGLRWRARLRKRARQAVASELSMDLTTVSGSKPMALPDI